MGLPRPGQPSKTCGFRRTVAAESAIINPNRPISATCRDRTVLVTAATGDQATGVLRYPTEPTVPLCARLPHDATDRPARQTEGIPSRWLRPRVPCAYYAY
eukprot:754575-Hanusia_phi.AAC.10